MPRTTRHLVHDITEIATRVSAINRDIVTAVAELLDAAPGYPTGGGGGGQRQLNDDGKPGGLDRYLMAPDPAGDDHASMDRALAMALAQITLVHHLVTKWSADPKPPATDQTLTGGDCVACGTYCPGGATRLRAGLCNACRMAYRRWQQRGGSERADWLLERRRDTSTADV